MAPTNRPAPILPPSTSSHAQHAMHSQHQQQHDSPTSAPSSEPRMNPPSLPRSLMTPVRDTRESSVVSAPGSSSRKPRQNLDERDHILMVKHCFEQRGNFKEGTKAQFWSGVNAAFQRDTGKILAQMSATVARLVESRRRQIADWEAGIIPQKPGGELNERLDEWMDFLRSEDSEAEAERMRQVEARRRVEEQRKEARRQAIAAEQLVNSQQQAGAVQAQSQQPPTADMGQQPQGGAVVQGVATGPGGDMVQGGEIVQANGQEDMNGYRPQKRRRRDTERQLTREMQSQLQQEHAWAYAQEHPLEPPKRVIVEGALTKEDWREIMGNDARLRALEGKVEKIELIVSQNNKILLQLLQNQNNRQDRNEEERVPVHLDAEFERDYL